MRTEQEDFVTIYIAALRVKRWLYEGLLVSFVHFCRSRPLKSV
jgi:hypothetical protein